MSKPKKQSASKRLAESKKLGDSIDAINQIKELLGDFPHCIAGWLELGLMYRRLRDRELALSTLKKAIALAPQNQNVKLHLATEQLHFGQFQECRQTLQELIEINPENIIVIIKLGELYRKENNRAEALKLFQKAVEINSTSVMANFNFAIELRELGDFEESEKHFIQALKYDQNHFNTLVHMGILQQRKKNLTLALEYFQKAIEIKPKNLSLQLTRLNILYDSDRIDEAKTSLKLLQQQYSEEHSILIYSGNFAKKLGQREKALQWFSLAQKKASNSEDNLEAQILVIEELKALGKLDQAIKLIETIIEEFPENIQYQILKGSILKQQLNLIAAVNLYKSILDSEPTHLKARLELATTYRELGHIETAINLMEETHQLLGENIQIFIQLGILNQALEKWAIAERWYREACREYPDNSQGYSHLANLTFLQGKTDLAMSLLQKAQAKIPNSLPILIRLVDFQIRLGNLDLSYQLLQQGLQEFPNQIQLLWQLCKVQMQKGEYNAALEALDRISTDNQEWIRKTQNLRANIYFYLYEYDQAEKYFKQAINSTPVATTERNRLATILMLTGRIDEARQEFKVATEELKRKAPLGKSAVPLKSHPAMVTNELRMNPPLMAKLQATQQETGEERILSLGALLAQEPNYLGTALYLARELRAQGIFDGLQQALSQKTKNLPTIPQRIVQFWDQPEAPEEVQRICQSWRKLNPEYEYIRFSLETAVVFLKEHYEQKVLDAFANCDQPATQADFFRLAYLNKMGGFYADADDLCRQSLDSLVNLNPELVILQEDFACIGNNFLGCIPGQSMIRAAFYQAVNSLSRYCNESPWFKTGPGLITSVVCSGLIPYLTYADYQAWPRILVLTQAQLQKIINGHMYLFYKRTNKSWQQNAYNRRIKVQL
ncbi:MAG: tetratricopeptide repeat protein [Cyanobacteria bacterium P01_F01_bin.143]